MKIKLHNPRLRFIGEPIEDGGGSTEEPAAGTETTTEEPSEEPQEEAEQESTEDDSKDLAWHKKELERTRRESAGYRTQLREAQEALTKAKSPEEFAAALEEIGAKATASDHELWRERAARKANLPDGMEKRLVGTTEEEFLADAKALAKDLKTASGTGPAPDPDALGGGLDGVKPEKFDPVAEAAKYRTRPW